MFSYQCITHKDTELILAGDRRGREGRLALLEAAYKIYDVCEIPDKEMDQEWVSCHVQMHSIRKRDVKTS